MARRRRKIGRALELVAPEWLHIKVDQDSQRQKTLDQIELHRCRRAGRLAKTQQPDQEPRSKATPPTPPQAPARGLGRNSGRSHSRDATSRRLSASRPPGFWKFDHEWRDARHKPLKLPAFGGTTCLTPQKTLSDRNATRFTPRLMKLLVIGSGGREHALVWKLAQSPNTTQLWCAPGNSGTGLERLRSNSSWVENVPLAADNLDGLLAFAQSHKPDLTVVGPDNPLAAGIVDRFQAAGFKIWGPNQRAAQFEASKAFSQEFMLKHGIPTARSGTFTTAEEARRFADSLDGRCAVKADGLALGKGVLLTHSPAEASKAIDEILVQRAFGQAGDRIVIQELLEGTEISLHALCDGRTAKLFPTAQDHKRALDGDQGLNTGGMGTYSPAPFLDDAALQSVGDQILKPWLAGCAAEGIDFKGILYPGVMLTAQGPKVLEFNARFGDPEAQVYLTRLENDLPELLLASAEGSLDRHELRWSPRSSVCVVLASEGYPGSSPKGRIIYGLGDVAALPDVKVFHAGSTSVKDDILTNGGRVLGVTALGNNLAAAQARAYSAVNRIYFKGMQFRKDIASKGIAATK